MAGAFLEQHRLTECTAGQQNDYQPGSTPLVGIDGDLASDYQP
jgi:hypothetical protein